MCSPTPLGAANAADRSPVAVRLIRDAAGPPSQAPSTPRTPTAPDRPRVTPRLIRGAAELTSTVRATAGADRSTVAPRAIRVDGRSSPELGARPASRPSV